MKLTLRLQVLASPISYARHCGALLALLCLGWTAAGLRAAEPATAGGGNSIILTIEGKVEVMKVGTTAWAPAQTNQVLRTNDRLRTGLKSRATLRLSNQSTLRVNQLTTLEMQPPADQSNQAVLDLKAGAAYLFSRDQPVETQFRTPQASGAIRGTEFDLKVAENGLTVVTLLEGLVDLSNNQGQSVSLASGEQGTVEPGRAPSKTSVLDASNIIQWALYYPGVLDLDEVGLDASEKQALEPSLTAYRSGELLRAAALYPDERNPITDAERLYKAAIYLASGQLEETEKNLQLLTVQSPLSSALRQVVAAVKLQPFSRAEKPTTASEWLAESIYQQAHGKLEEARAAARASVEHSPNFGYAWARLAELEFGFGRNDATAAALEKALQSTPMNAQAHALDGFVLAAKNRIAAARAKFDKAIELDSALGNGWLGRGLTRIRSGDAEGGRQDLQTAAALEPNRAIFRSYLGKAFSNSRDLDRADREIRRSRELDPNDPTSWLYSALLNQQQNRINEGVSDLEKSQALNDNRSLFRSKLLLDQDRAVRGVNLASLYKDAGMTDLSVREASRAVTYDYANSAAHLFLANSYEAVLDPKKINLRYETPYFSEFLMAKMLAPVGAGSLSQNVSQQEYSKLMEKNGFGLSSSTEYFSSGEWRQRAGHVGVFGNSAYGLDFEYRNDPGQRPNNDVEESIYYVNIKQQITPKDTLFIYSVYQDFESGDVSQYYDNSREGNRTLRADEVQGPQFFAGYNHEWSPGVNTLFFAGRFEADLGIESPRVVGVTSGTSVIRVDQAANGSPARVATATEPWSYQRDTTVYSVEAQQIWQTDIHAVIAGIRYQDGDIDASSLLRSGLQPSGSVSENLGRFSAYGYYHWQMHEAFRLIGGVTYDYLEYPVNIDSAPLTPGDRAVDQVSPKAGFLLTPWTGGQLRGAYTRSLGGLSFDTSLRLEPTLVAGFNQAFRSLAPESVVGFVPGSEFETYNVIFEQTFKTRTYASIEANWLQSDAERTVGVINTPAGFPPRSVAGQQQQTLRFDENSLAFTVNQLLGKEWSLGAQYRVSRAQLDSSYPGLPPTVPGATYLDVENTAILHRVLASAAYHHRCGFFSSLHAEWYQQSNQGYQPSDIPGDDFWQFHAFAGYRFHRRLAEIRVGLLNIFDQDYQLNPLNLYNELPRERTFTASFRFNF